MEWFKHKTASHDDPDISDAMDELGDFGYMGFFVIAELYGQEFSHLDSDGFLTFSQTFVRRKLRKSWTKVELLLNFFQKRKRLTYKTENEYVKINFPKFIELASNWTSRQASQPTEAPTEAPTAIEVEEDKKKKRKENKERHCFASDSIPFRLGILLWRSIKREGTEQKEPDFQKWARSFDVWMRNDKKDGDWILQLMYNAREDKFWSEQLRSPDKIRQKVKEGKLDKFIPSEWLTNEELAAKMKEAVEKENGCVAVA